MLSPSAAYFLLQGLQILALWVPPFRGRALLFVPAIITCAIVLHSDRISDDPQTSYAFGMAWPSYLATIERLLFSIPELSFWRVGEKRGGPLSYGFGSKKLSWSAGQFFNPRGIHWNYQVKGITSVEEKPEFRSRKAFIYSRMVRFVMLCLGYDLLHSYLVSQHRHVGSINGDYTPLNNRPFIWSFTITAAAAFVIFSGIELSHLIASVTFVGLGLSRPEDWPPLYGNVQDAFTVRRVWGCFWHKLIRRTLSEYSKFIVRTTRIKDETTGAVLHLLLVFFLSGVFHALPLRVMLHQLPLGTVFFFSSQAVAILFEETVIAMYTEAVGSNIESRLWHRLVGFAWVTAWLYWSLPFFLDDMFASGMMDASTLPFSAARAMARLFGLGLKR